MAWYDLEDNAKDENKREYVARCRYEKVVHKMASCLMDLLGNELEENVQYRIVTTNSFNAICVIDALTNKYEITEIDIVIYRMNVQAVNFLKELIDSGSVRVNIVISSFFRENKKYERWCNELYQYAVSKPNVVLKYEWSHAKVMLAKTACGRHIVFEGSGNLSDNARIEQYIIEDSRKSYDFHKSWINEIINGDG